MEIYREPLFLLFPVAASLVSMAAFVLFAGPLTLLAWLDPAALRHRRLQGDRGHPERFIRPGLARWLVNNAIMTGLVFAAWPLLRLSGVHAGSLPPWWVALGQLVFFVYLDDFLYYWMHRTLHRPWLYRRIHGVHHRVTTPWAVTAHYMHPLEFVLTGLLTITGPLLLGSHVAVLWTYVAFRQWIAAEGHCGYELPLNPSRLFPGYGGNAFHDFHHMKFHGNYSGFLGWIDRLLGTTSKGYLEAVRRSA